MAYHNLSECSLNPSERLDEVFCKIIQDCAAELTQREAEFVAEMETADYGI